MQTIFERLTAPAVVDATFVVVDDDATTAAPLVHRPQGGRPPSRMTTSPAIWGDIAPTGPTVDDARMLLTSLLYVPCSDVRIVAEVGRCILVEYEPMGKADPDIVLATWPSARPINRIIVELQNARAVNWGNWVEFWAGINRYIDDLAEVLKASTATGEERSFILSWAYNVRDTGRATVDQGRRYTTYF